MKIEGNIEHIIFRNNNTGYTALVVETDVGRVVLNGKFPTISEGEAVVCEGEFKQTKYGEQFCVDTCKIMRPTGIKGIEKFLASGLIKGVGEITAKKLVEKFGTETLEILENQPEKIVALKGFSKNRVDLIRASYLENKQIQEVIMLLQDAGVTTHMALKIYEVYKEETIQTVQSNPYKLIEDIDGIGFITADDIAFGLNIEKDSLFRIRAGIIYLLKDDATTSGSTYAVMETLKTRALELLKINISEDSFNSVITTLENENHIKLLTIDGMVCIALKKYYDIEKSLAKKLLGVKACAVEINTDISNDITHFEKISNIIFHENQKNAIEMAIKCGTCVITGGPGTGKTTIIKCILQILKQNGLKINLVAPTGRASKRLSETTGIEAKTIHRLLDLDYKDGKGYFTFNERTRLDADVVVIDEMSMVDVSLMNSLLSALPNGAKLVMVGDKDQLPSVGAGNVLKDIMSSGIIPCCMLTEIYRQEKESLIVYNAHKINNGIMPTLSRVDSDFFFEKKQTHEEIFNATVELVTKRLPSFLNINAREVQVLAPMKKGVCGTINLNAKLQEVNNPHGVTKPQYSVGEMVFREGDKVMQTMNNYSLEWKKLSGEMGKGVFNGDIGTLEAVNPAASEFKVVFDDGRIVTYKAVDLKDLSLAYAISVHKSQGSEFDVVVLPVYYVSKSLTNRNLFYTAVTRAKKMVVVCGSVQTIKIMVDNNYIEKRYSMLKDFLIIQ